MVCPPFRKGRHSRKNLVSGEDDAVGSVSRSMSQGSLWERKRATGAKEMEAALRWERRTPPVGKSHTVLPAVNFLTTCNRPRPGHEESMAGSQSKFKRELNVE